ncbi:hypothetical protein AAFN85_00590 [Mucilaginibacter sp. CAU 1740]|uniref:hypothetical protein n=1 Tax=Mucilaginibacter sp. CAU 1740 TaxID=3140365 RepID=UPI00325B955B
MDPVNENDWKTMPLPEQQEGLALNRTLSDEESKYLLPGHRPRDMDDRWFIYIKDQWMYFHRSWTGVCIFKIRLILANGKYTLTEGFVNRDPEQFKSTSVEADVDMLNRVIDIIVKIEQRESR